MMRLIAALTLASFSLIASAAEKPLPVTVTNPVVPVEVSNAEPIPVTNVGETRVPFMGTQIVNNTGPFVQTAIDIPNGKRLVIETVAAGAQIPPGEKLSVLMVYSLDGTTAWTPIPVDDQGVSPEGGASLPKQKFAGLHAVRMMADGGTGTDDVRFQISRSGANANSANNEFMVSIHGYLVDP